MLVHNDSMTISTLTELYHMVRGLLCSAPRHQTLPYFSYLFHSSFHSSFFLHSFVLSSLLVWGICIGWYIRILLAELYRVVRDRFWWRCGLLCSSKLDSPSDHLTPSLDHKAPPTRDVITQPHSTLFHSNIPYESGLVYFKGVLGWFGVFPCTANFL